MTNNSKKPHTSMLGLAAALLSIILAIFSYQPAQASETVKPDSPNEGFQEVSSEVEQFALDAAASFLNNLPHGAQVATDEARVSQPSGTRNLMVAAPVSGNGYDEGSFVGVVIDSQSGDVVNTVQNKATKQSDTKYLVETWVDEGPGTSKTIDIGQPDSELEAYSAPDPDVIDCLNALGVSTVVATIIISTCATACAVTVGAGCIACVAGFTAIGGASVGRCLST